MDSVEKALKELRKAIEKGRIMQLASSGVAKSYKNRRRSKKKRENELDHIKQTIDNSSNGLSNSIKGAFGKKLTLTLNNQKSKLDTLK